MLTVTNGSVSRTYKPADYEGRTVTLSFSADPGDDLDAGLATLSALAEKHARQVPRDSVVDGNPVQGEKRAAPPTQDAMKDVATATTQPPANSMASAGVADITDAELLTACFSATFRMKAPEPTKAVIARFAPTMREIPMDKRAAFLKALDELQPAQDY